MIEALPPEDKARVRRFQRLPMMVLDLDSVDSLEAAVATGVVLAVYEDRAHEASLTESLGLIRQPEVQALGATGAGTTVAVLDTGTDYTHSAFGSCVAPGDPGCKVSFAQDFAPDDGVLDDNGHGTNVAGIVLGVAPDARVAALDVFRTNGLAYSSDILSAVDWVMLNRATHNIVAMNLSLGGGYFTSSCPNDVFAVPLAQARAAGILPVVASGNDARTDGMASPACAPAAVSVGALYDTSFYQIAFSSCVDSNTQPNDVTCFSNSASFLTMLAPGALVSAGGYMMAGTSQAAPHVAGATAVLQAAHAGESVEDTLSRMLQSGPPTTDSRNSITKPRLDLAEALVFTSTDTQPPSGTLQIAGGAAVTRTATVTLSFDATDDVGVTEVCLTQTSTCTDWYAYAPQRAWVLVGGQGSNSVFARFRDAAGNESAPASDDIVLDDIPPSDGLLSVTASAADWLVSWTDAGDAGTGVAGYILSYRPDGVPSSCMDGSLLYEGLATSFLHAVVQSPGAGYRLCAFDGAGNLSFGSAMALEASVDGDPPVGQLRIENGSGWVSRDFVQVQLTAQDPSGVQSYCLSNTPSCSAWRAFRPSVWHGLDLSTETSTVYAWFRDNFGNASSTPVFASARRDGTPPTDGVVEATPTAGAIVIGWAGFDDADSGVAGYRVVRYASSVIPGSCFSGELVYEGVDALFSDTSAVLDGSPYSYRVCAVDRVGLVSGGVGVRTQGVPETDPPTGTVEIAGGLDFVTSDDVLLTLTATDASGVASMCVSNGSSCSDWKAYRPTVQHRLASTSGSNTVNVWFRDIYGQETPSPVSDTVGFDTTGPSDGSVDIQPAEQGGLQLSFSGYSDAESGIVGYRVVYYESSTIPRTCWSGLLAYEGAQSSFVHGDLVSGRTYGYRVCASNGAGIWSGGATGVARAVAELDPPVGQVVVGEGTGWVASTSVLLSLSAVDASGVGAMCVSNSEPCSSWRSYRTLVAHELSGSVGPQTVYAQFRDIHGLESETSSATVQVDSSGPSDGTLSLTSVDRAVQLDWSGFDDAESGVNGYRVVYYASSVTPRTCQSGLLAYEGSDTSFLHSGLVNGQSYGYRVCARNRAGLWSDGVVGTEAPLAENDPPVGSFVIGDGGGWTNTVDVVLSFNATDASGVAAVCVSNTASCSSWRAYRSTMSHQLSGGSGSHTVRVWFRDTLGSVSDEVSATTSFDATPPDDGLVEAAASDGTIELSWSGFADADSGVRRYRVVYYPFSAVPRTCFSGTPLYEGTGSSVRHADLANGQSYGYRVCAQNRAGSWSAGASLVAAPVPESDPPVGTLVVGDGAGWMQSADVLLTLSATDDSGVAAVCLSNTESCSAWRAYRTSIPHTLAGASGTQSVYAWFRDIHGNVSDPVSATVQFDGSAPTDGSSTVVAADSALELSWSGFDDAESGVAEYRVVYYPSSVVPGSCWSGRLAYEGASTSFTHTGLTNGTTHTYRICARNSAGLWSAGSSASGTPAAAVAALVPFCSGANCGASSGSSYSGSGIGIWRYENSSNAAETIDFTISGVQAGQEATLVFSNGSDVDTSAPSAGAASTSVAAPAGGQWAPSGLDPRDAWHEHLLASNQAVSSQLLPATAAAPAPLRPLAPPAVGTSRSWNDTAASPVVAYTAVVRSTCSLPSGRNAIFWVDPNAWGTDLDQASLAYFETVYCGVDGAYARGTALTGDVWGAAAAGYGNLIQDGASLLDINIVFLQVPAGTGWGGYFHGVNALTNAAGSNQALVFFINAAGAGASPAYYAGTLVHEQMHMINFYQRQIAGGAGHETWLEEMSAMMSEDIIGPAVVSGYDKILTSRLQPYVEQTGGNISLVQWGFLSSDSYRVGGSFGAFLNRRYGVPLFQDLVACSASSYACVDGLIQGLGGRGYGDEFDRMGASAFGTLPATNLPDGFGYPSGTAGSYALDAYDTSGFVPGSPTSALNGVLPATSHSYHRDTVGASSYGRTGVVVPPGSAVLLVIE